MVKRRLKVNGEIVSDDHPSAGRTLDNKAQDIKREVKCSTILCLMLNTPILFKLLDRS
jgi:hypothetical protein